MTPDHPSYRALARAWLDLHTFGHAMLDPRTSIVARKRSMRSTALDLVDCDDCLTLALLRMSKRQRAKARRRARLRGESLPRIYIDGDAFAREGSAM